MKPCTWNSREKYELLIGPLREVARAKGYALAVHGSLVRDIDLVAIPWTREAVPSKELAEAIRAKIEEVNGAVFDNPFKRENHYFENGQPGSKPHGRLVWSIHLTDQLGQGPYIDLSVMPPRPREADEDEFDRYVREHNPRKPE